MPTNNKVYLYCLGVVLSIPSLILLIVVGTFGLLSLPVSRKYYINQLIAIDQLFNAHFCGDPDETISSRRGKGRGGNWLRKAIDWFFGRNHCTTYIEEDEGKNESR